MSEKKSLKRINAQSLEAGKLYLSDDVEIVSDLIFINNDQTYTIQYRRNGEVFTNPLSYLKVESYQYFLLPEDCQISDRQQESSNAEIRKQHPIFSGLLKYFPDALMAVSHCSWQGNQQQNPGEHLHWNRSKSGDEKDALMRHLLESGKMDSDGILHSTKVAWRALGALQKELEQTGKAPLSEYNNTDNS